MHTCITHIYIYICIHTFSRSAKILRVGKILTRPVTELQEKGLPLPKRVLGGLAPEATYSSTAHHFMDLLSVGEYNSLMKAAQVLNGCTIRIGTTCSGIDVATVVLHRTLEALNSRFSVHIQAQTVFMCEKDAEKRAFLMDAHKGAVQHMFEDVNVFSLGVGLCAITGMVIKVPEVDVLISGPSCKNFSLMRASRKAFAQCYEDGEGCSGETYTAGFKDAIASTGCRIAFFENVLGVSQRIVNKNGEVSEPQIEVVKRDLLSLGHGFEFCAVDSQHYLLPQRRNRIWGSSDSTLRLRDVPRFEASMASTMQQLRSSTRFRLQQFMNPSLPEEIPHLASHLSQLEATQKAATKARVDVKEVTFDTHTSEGRLPEWFGYGCTCIRPTHAIYSLGAMRYLTGNELLLCQGIFPSEFPVPAAFTSLTSSQAADFAGNAFSATVLQAKLIASFVHNASWQVIANPAADGSKLAAPQASSFFAKTPSRSGVRRSASGNIDGPAKRQRKESQGEEPDSPDVPNDKKGRGYNSPLCTIWHWLVSVVAIVHQSGLMIQQTKHPCNIVCCVALNQKVSIFLRALCFTGSAAR